MKWHLQRLKIECCDATFYRRKRVNARTRAHIHKLLSLIYILCIYLYIGWKERCTPYRTHFLCASQSKFEFWHSCAAKIIARQNVFYSHAHSHRAAALLPRIVESNKTFRSWYRNKNCSFVVMRRFDLKFRAHLFSDRGGINFQSSWNSTEIDADDYIDFISKMLSHFAFSV